MDDTMIRERNELLQQLAGNVLEPVDENSEVTAAMLAKKTGLSINACRDRLLKLENDGKLVSRMARGKKGNVVRAYRTPT